MEGFMVAMLVEMHKEVLRLRAQVEGMQKEK
jgi:hypothetical protein